MSLIFSNGSGRISVGMTKAVTLFKRKLLPHCRFLFGKLFYIVYFLLKFVKRLILRPHAFHKLFFLLAADAVLRPRPMVLKPLRFFEYRIVVRTVYRHLSTRRTYHDIAVARGKAVCAVRN